MVEACNRPQTYFCSEKAGSYDNYSVTTGEEAKPVSSNGGTTAKYLPNAVSFGPGMPGEKYMGHTANEFKKLSNLLLDTQMFSEMMLRIGNLETL
ncbi:hypothetical protein IIA28_14400 [candidate division KSB1 bacterium]|nr:hypothetical protein [candidate division KSB1 bacterium]